MAAKTLYLVRHGETPWNRDRIFRGREDIELSETGLLQACRVGTALAHRKVDQLYTSPLRRCQQTTLAIRSACNAPIRALAGLTDVDYGQWAGKRDQDVAAAWADLHARYQRAPQDVTFPGGESLAAVQKRAVGAIDEALAEPWSTAVVVTHRVVLKLILLACLGAPIDRFWSIRVDPCSLSAITVEGERRVVCLANDIGHLRGIEGSAADF